MEAGQSIPPLWPIVIYTGGCVLLALGMVLASFFLGERHREHATGEPYESGIVSTGSARLRFTVQYYMVAVFFVVFDLEAAFLLAWAVAVREVGWTGFIEAMIFIGVLLVGLVYLIRQGALDWAARGPRKRGYA
jgi:NADH-quinone oxidoreductase subunit A